MRETQGLGVDFAFPRLTLNFILLSATGTMFASIAVDLLGLVDNWDPNPDAITTTAISVAFFMQVLAAAFEVKSYRGRQGPSSHAYISGILSLLTCVVLSIGMLLTETG